MVISGSTLLPAREVMMAVTLNIFTEPCSNMAYHYAYPYIYKVCILFHRVQQFDTASIAVGPFI